MEHIKTLNTKNLQNSVKKGGCGECRLPASPHVKLPVQ